MAYREFYNPIESETPDYSPIAQGIANLFNGLGEVYSQRQKKSDQYKYALEYGKFENDNKFNEEYVKSVVGLGREDYKKSGTPSAQLLNMEQQGKRMVGDQKAQFDRFTKLDARIKEKATEDPYYNPELDKIKLQEATFGKDNDVDFRTRGQRLEEVSKSIGNDPNAFRIKEYTSNWVKQLGKKKQDRTTKTENGERQYSYESPFVDPKTGKPGVTDNHAREYLDSRPEVLSRIQLDIDKDLQKDVKAIKQLNSKGDKRTAWADGLSDQEILLQIKGQPALNPYAPKDKDENPIQYNDLILKKAKNNLTEAADIAEKVTVDFKKTGGSGSDGNVKNDNIGHSGTFYTNAIGTGGSESVNKVSGPGGVLMIKKGVTAGRPIVIEADSKNAFNYRSGKNTNREGRGKFNLTGYQLAPYTTDGKLVPIAGNDAEEMKNSIKNIPDEQLRKMKPTLDIALQGYTIDESKILGDISNKSYQLNEQLGEAIEKGDAEKVAALRSQIEQIGQLRSSFNLADVYDEDIINAAAKTGIKSTRVDQLLQADRSDLDKIKTITDGLDLKSQSSWSPEMKEVNDTYKARWEEANKKSPVVSDTEGGLDLKKKKKTYPLPAGQPRVVKQNGLTYTWSEQNGEYE